MDPDIWMEAKEMVEVTALFQGESDFLKVLITLVVLKEVFDHFFYPPPPKKKNMCKFKMLQFDLRCFFCP